MSVPFMSMAPRIVVLVALGLALVACGGEPTPESSAAPAAPDAVEPSAAPPAESPVEPLAEPAAEPPEEMDEQAAIRAAREQELANREADLALKEREAELARREAALTAQQTAAKPAPAPRPATTPPPSTRVTNAAAAPMTPAPPLVVPSGTYIPVEFTALVTTKTARVGDRVDARLAEDVTVEGRRALSAGTPVQGTVTEVISGTSKIGGVPTLGISFDTLALADGSSLALSGRLVEQGKSETDKDAAKIAGGTVAGAVIGHQIDGKKGTIIGGILGGAAGAAIAMNTGGDVSLPAGTIVGFELTAPIEVQP